jgi:hypothetical protein
LAHWWRGLAYLHGRSTDATKLHPIGNLTLTAGTNHVLASLDLALFDRL